MYSSLGYMYTLWWWFRLIVTIMGERNVYTKDAQKVRGSGSIMYSGLEKPQRWSVVQLVTLVLTFHCYVMGWLIVTIRGERMCTSMTQSSFSDGCYRLMCTLRVNGLHVRLLEGIWWDEDGWYSVPPYWAILKKVVSTVFSTFSAMWLED